MKLLSLLSRVQIPSVRRFASKFVPLMERYKWSTEHTTEVAKAWQCTIIWRHHTGSLQSMIPLFNIDLNLSQIYLDLRLLWIIFPPISFSIIFWEQHAIPPINLTSSKVIMSLIGSSWVFFVFVGFGCVFGRPLIKMQLWNLEGFGRNLSTINRRTSDLRLGSNFPQPVSMRNNRKAKQTAEIRKFYFVHIFCSTGLLLASARWVWSTFSTHFPPTSAED